MSEDEKKKRQEIEYEQCLQMKLGETHFAMIDGAVHVNHKIQCWQRDRGACAGVGGRRPGQADQ